ncbi:MAG: ribonuclease HII [Euryarchaeota archaeon]|nr:ribonuclease HII [Euryarchaeota archaeon]
MVCGVDEAGRGPVIGPMVVAGVCANEEFLREIGVRDSKRLTPGRRERLAELIKNEAERVVVRVVAPEEIDRMRESMTINELEVQVFSEVITELHAEVVYVDAADVNEERFAEKIKARVPFEVEIISRHKADDIYPAVSAASIIAKVERDRLIEKIASEIGDFGSGYPADPRTTEFLLQYYREHGAMPPHVRMSWKSVKKIIKRVEQSTLDAF